jgi:hypothetical protein
MTMPPAVPKIDVVGHTKLPWEAKGTCVFAGRSCIVICDTDNAPKARMEANARFIVQACNAHADLVEALADLLEVCEQDNPRAVAWHSAIDEARTALAKARAT